MTRRFSSRPLHFTADDLKPIELAKHISKESIVTTQGHLLPYLGYRAWNFYLSPQYELRKDTREAYLNPDYYLFDFWFLLCENEYIGKESKI